MNKGLLLILIVFISGSFVGANNSAKPYPKIYHTKNFVEKSKQEHYYLDLMFTPIGWSKDGKFAYITGKDPGGAGYDEIGYFRWVIQDMVTDKILWVSKDELEKGIPDNIIAEDELLDWVFFNYSKTYQIHFMKYGININTNLKILKFPLVYNDYSYQGSITDIFRETEYEIPDLISKYKVILSKDNVKKIFSQYNDNHSALMDVRVAGYVKSSYEPRIAVVLMNVFRGWEGPPHPVKCSFIGCHLETF